MFRIEFTTVFVEIQRCGVDTHVLLIRRSWNKLTAKSVLLQYQQMSTVDQSVCVNMTSTSSRSSLQQQQKENAIDVRQHRFPFCIVWTPIPLLTWLFPPVGHMGIATSDGVIRDFAGPYFVSEDNMAFGWPTKYWRLHPSRVTGGASAWDSAVTAASDEYKKRIHNLLCDNCHSHVAMALNLMAYDGRRCWNMFVLAAMVSWRGRYVSWWAAVRTWAPFVVVVCVAVYLSHWM